MHRSLGLIVASQAGSSVRDAYLILLDGTAILTLIHFSLCSSRPRGCARTGRNPASFAQSRRARR
jgi:hypothetical protein